MTHTVALFGAGKIGEAICALFSHSGRYKVLACDADGERAKAVAALFPKAVEARTLDLKDRSGTLSLLKGADAVISALPYHCNPLVAELAVESNVHYFDLTEDVYATKKVLSLAKKGGPCLVPQCGLAPGFISIAAAHLTKGFDKLRSVKLRVGALPIYPSNRLKYNLTWSTEGLINEYINLCEAIEGGEKRMVEPLEGYERFSLDGDEYEAFNTSGGLGTLADTLAGKVDTLNYKTIRYPGHRDLVAFLLKELRFSERREQLKQIFEESLPTTKQDKCIIFVEVQGEKGGLLLQRTYASTVYNKEISGRQYGAIQVTTAAGICAPVDMLLSEHVGGTRPGTLRSEDIPLDVFLENEFGRHYRDEKALGALQS